MARLRHCCCFSVRTGTLLLALLGVGYSLLNLSSYGGLAAVGSSETFHRTVNRLDQVFREWREHGELTEQELESLEAYLTQARELYPEIVTLGLICSGLALFKHALLLFGVLYRKSVLLVPYLVLGLAGLILSSLVAVGACILVFLYTSVVTGIVVSVFLTMFAWIGFYFWQVVLSHYMDLKEQVKRSKAITTALAFPPFPTG